jgi:hypothetical protein
MKSIPTCGFSVAGVGECNVHVFKDGDRCRKHQMKRACEMKEYRATSSLKWFRVEGNYCDGEVPLAQIVGFPGCDSHWYCLKQLWINDDPNDPGEWRDIEAVA